MLISTTKLQFCKTSVFFSTFISVSLLSGCGGTSKEESAVSTVESLVAASASATTASATNASVITNTSSNNTQLSDTSNSSPSFFQQAISSEQEQTQSADQAEPVTQNTQSTQVQLEPVPQSNEPAQTQSEPVSQSNEPEQAETVSEPSVIAPAPQNTANENSSESNSENSGESNSDNSGDNPEAATQDTPQESSQDNTQVTEQNDQNTRRTTRILPLGDSITNGGEGYPSYRRSLWFMLRNADYDVDFVGSQSGFDGPVSDDLKDFDLDHEGHWAWEAGELESNLSDWLNGYTPDIVLLHAGTNDVDRGQSHSSTISELDGIVNILREKNANVVILLAKIIPMQNRDTEDFNEFIESFAASKNTSPSPVVIVDQHEGYDPFNENYDNYHPNFIGEEKMATRWLNALQPYLD